MKTVKRWVITHRSKLTGMITLAQGAQGRYTYETKQEAEDMIKSIMSNNVEATIKSVYGLPLVAREVDCWAGHFDPVRIYFEEEN